MLLFSSESCAAQISVISSEAHGHCFNKLIATTTSFVTKIEFLGYLESISAYDDIEFRDFHNLVSNAELLLKKKLQFQCILK